MCPIMNIVDSWAVLQVNRAKNTGLVDRHPKLQTWTRNVEMEVALHVSTLKRTPQKKLQANHRWTKQKKIT